MYPDVALPNTKCQCSNCTVISLFAYVNYIRANVSIIILSHVMQNTLQYKFHECLVEMSR